MILSSFVVWTLRNAWVSSLIYKSDIFIIILYYTRLYLYSLYCIVLYNVQYYNNWITPYSIMFYIVLYTVYNTKLCHAVYSNIFYTTLICIGLLYTMFYYILLSHCSTTLSTLYTCICIWVQSNNTFLSSSSVTREIFSETNWSKSRLICRK